MSTISSDSRSYRAAGRPDRLLRAAVTSFCSITRPTRRETAQLDDLSGPLLGSISDDTLRFIAASLSDSPFAPPGLIRRLADLPAEMSAPLLLRSPVLGNIDLLALIGRHGMGHARVIAARNHLDERLARLIASLGLESEQHATSFAPPVENRLELPATQRAGISADSSLGTADDTRDLLRTMMRPAASAEPDRSDRIRLRWDGDPGAYRKLRSTALTGVPALFDTALADALDLDLKRAGAIARASDMAQLIVALRALRLAEEEAFLIVHCIRPARLSHVRTISAFFDAYNAIADDQAAMIVEQWRSAAGRGAPFSRAVAANQQREDKRLKAS